MRKKNKKRDTKKPTCDSRARISPNKRRRVVWPVLAVLFAVGAFFAASAGRSAVRRGVEDISVIVSSAMWVGDVEFRGNRISFHTTPESFLSLDHRKRAELLADQTAAVMKYMEDRIPEGDLIDRLSRLAPDGPGRLRIASEKNAGLERILRRNVQFATTITITPKQEKGIMGMVDFLAAHHPDKKNEITYAKVLEKTVGFTDTDIMAGRLSPRSVDFLEQEFITRDIVRAQARGAATDLEKIEAIMDWVFVNVSNHITRMTPENEWMVDYNDIPFELMIRGMGDCDRSAWVMSSLAFHAGLNARVVYLNLPNLVSFHTVAEVRLDGRWFAVDPFNNLIYPAGAVELSRTDEKFRNSFVMIHPMRARQVLPIMHVAETICRFYSPDQRLFFGVEETVGQYLTEVYGSREDPGARPPASTAGIFDAMLGGAGIELPNSHAYLKRWELPFWLRGYYFGGLQKMNRDVHLPSLLKIREARIAQLMGKYDEAERQFDILAVDTESRLLFKEERDYFRILNFYYQGRYDRVAASVQPYRTRYPDTPRNTMLSYVLAHSLHRLGRKAEAAAQYPMAANFMGRGSIQPPGL